MNSEIQLRRLEAAKLADAINKIEGVPISAYAKKLSTQWVRGEITGEEMKAALISVHKRCPEPDA
ncbi:MAG: antitoxin VbhA family protein [Paludibacter sp.]